MLGIASLGSLAVLARGQSDNKASAPEPSTPGLSASPAAVPPALSPQESLGTFRVAPGFRVELVASEPLVEAPVAMAFDPQGRLWVCEMRDYMPDVDGKTPDVPKGRVVILEDTDGDGRMDKRTVFLDNLSMPRAVAFVHGGVLVAEPPNLWLCPSPGADGKAPGKTALVPDYAAGGSQPEYLPNGLLRALDNWTYSARSTVRYRFDAPGGKLLKEPTAMRGQWGITQDDWGRLFYNYNSDHLRGDVIPSEYLARNPNLRDPVGVNVEISRDMTVFPTHPNPGVNRGYQQGILREDGTLRSSTATCGPLIYRGDLFPPDCEGNAFLCEPAANLVRRDVLTEDPAGGWTVRNAYGNAEFLASTDERFRPVSLANGPDGALYVVDMHRGVIQHTAYMTPYLRQQVAARGLDKPIDQGRIYRVVPDGAKVAGVPRTIDLSTAGLVQLLSHPNGWWRDTAQRILVESGDTGAVPALRALATSGDNPLGRLHALWTLQGMGQADAETVGKALDDPHPPLRAAAVRLSEPFLPSDPALSDRVCGLSRDEAPEVQRQLALTLGGATGPKAEAALAAVLERSAGSEFVRAAAVSGLRGRELEFLGALLANPAWTSNATGRAALLGDLAKCVFQEGKPTRVQRLLDVASEQSAALAWRGSALLDGLASLAAHPGKKALTPLTLAAPSAALAKLESATNGTRAKERVARVDGLFIWPGKSSASPAATPGANPASLVALPPAQQARFERGRTAFNQTCAACHQPDGQGQEGLAPPLAGSAWVVGPESRIVRIALHGVEGGINVNGRRYEMEMPPLGALGDEELAAILTYVRQTWGSAGPVEPATVAAIRAQTAARAGSWTAPELQQVP